MDNSIVVHDSKICESDSQNRKREFETTAARPVPLSVNLDKIPDSLKSLKVWCLWSYQNRDGRWSKIPFQPRGASDNYRINRGLNWYMCQSDNPATWASFDAVTLRLRTHPDDFSGLGIMLQDGLLGCDLDNCIDADGTLKEWAKLIIRQLATYAELSPSGTGVKLFMRASFPVLSEKMGISNPKSLRKKIKFRDGEVEFYDRTSSRFFAVTGRRLEDVPGDLQDRQDAFETVYRTIFRDSLQTSPETREKGTKGTTSGLTINPDKLTVNPDKLTVRPEDEDLLEMARKAANGDRFRALYDVGDLTDFKGDHSSADLALCGLLSFWTGPDPDRIDRLFRRSALFRDKWEDREDYRDRTIDKALTKGEFYNWGRHEERKLMSESNGFFNELFADAGRDEPLTVEPSRTRTEDYYNGLRAEGERREQERKTIRLEDWDSDCLVADSQKDDWIVPQMLEFGCLGIFTGLPFSGKSTITAELFASIARGSEFYGKPVASVPFILMDFENRERILINRIRACLDGDEGRIRDLYHRVKPTNMPRPLTPDFIGETIVAVRDAMEGHPRGLVCIDTLRSGFAATEGYDEVDASSMAKLFGSLKNLAVSTGWAILVLHHNAKGTNQYSGSTAISAMADYLWNWQVDKESLKGRLSVEGRSDYEPPLEFRYNPETKRNELMGTSKDVKAREKQQDDDTDMRMVRNIIPVHRSNAWNTGQVEEEAGKTLDMDPKRTRELLKLLRDGNLIKHEKGLKNSTLHWREAGDVGVGSGELSFWSSDDSSGASSDFSSAN